MSFNFFDPKFAANLVQLLGTAAAGGIKCEPKAVHKEVNAHFDYYSWLIQVNKIVGGAKSPKEYKKRKYSVKGSMTPYAVIAGLAIFNAKKEVTSRDIYRFAKHYFSGCVTSSYWKNSIRNVICTKPLFRKMFPSNEAYEPRSYLWSLNPQLSSSLFEMITAMEKINPNTATYGLSDPSMWDRLKDGTAGLPSEDIFVDIEEKRKDAVAMKLLKTSSTSGRSIPTVSDEDESSSSSPESTAKADSPIRPSLPLVSEEEESSSRSPEAPEEKPVIDNHSSPPVVSEEEEVSSTSSEESREEPKPIFSPKAFQSVRKALPRPAPYFIPGKPVFPPRFQVPPGFNPDFNNGKGPFPFGIPIRPQGSQGFFPLPPQFNIIQVNNFFGHPMPSYPAPSTSVSDVVGQSFTIL